MGWGNWVAYPGGKEGEGGSPGCVKGKPWQPQPETAVAAHVFLLTSSGILAQEVVMGT